jgi:hypothetical protein
LVPGDHYRVFEEKDLRTHTRIRSLG